LYKGKLEVIDRGEFYTKIRLILSENQVIAIHDLITKEPLISRLLKIVKKINLILFNITCIYYKSIQVVGIVLFYRKVGIIAIFGWVSRIEQVSVDSHCN
jgi:hypothetical protein